METIGEDLLSIKIEQQASRTDEEFLDQDRNMLFNLITDIENYLADLRGRQRTSTFNKACAVLVPLLSWLTYAGVEPWLIYKSINDKDDFSFTFSAPSLFS